MDSVSGIGFWHNEAPDVVTKGQRGGSPIGSSLLPLGTLAQQIDCKTLSPGRGLICPVNILATYGRTEDPITWKSERARVKMDLTGKSCIIQIAGPCIRSGEQHSPMRWIALKDEKKEEHGPWLSCTSTDPCCAQQYL